MKQIIKLIGIIAIIAMLFVSSAAAADNGTVNGTIGYAESEQYEQDLQYWYDYYVSERMYGDEAQYRGMLTELLHTDSISAKDRNDAIMILLGWDFRLDNYMDESKRTIDPITGAVHYDLGVANWWMKLFGVGIDEEKLPQTRAEGDALYKLYNENYDVWVSILNQEKEERAAALAMAEDMEQ